MWQLGNSLPWALWPLWLKIAVIAWCVGMAALIVETLVTSGREDSEIDY